MFPELFSIGYTLFDQVIYPDGKSHRDIGGGAYFASRIAAALLKRDVGLVTRIGGDIDLTRFDGLRREGIQVLLEQLSTCAQLRYTDLQDFSKREITLELNVSRGLGPGDIPPGWLVEAKWIHLATMPPLQQRLFLETLQAEKGREEKSNAPTILIDSDVCFLKDQESRDLVANNFLRADVVCMNRHEAQALSDIISRIPTLLLKKDAEGAELLHFGKLKARVTAPPITLVNSTGAGDVFAGSFMAFRLQGKSPEVALEGAVQQASKMVSSKTFDAFHQCV